MHENCELIGNGEGIYFYILFPLGSVDFERIHVSKKTYRPYDFYLMVKIDSQRGNYSAVFRVEAFTPAQSCSPVLFSVFKPSSDIYSGKVRS